MVKGPRGLVKKNKQTNMKQKVICRNKTKVGILGLVMFMPSSVSTSFSFSGF